MWSFKHGERVFKLQYCQNGASGFGLDRLRVWVLGCVQGGRRTPHPSPKAPPPLRPRGRLTINQIQLVTCCPLDNAPTDRAGSPLEVSGPSPAARGPRMHRGHTHTHTNTQAGGQAGGQAERQYRHAERQLALVGTKTGRKKKKTLSTMLPNVTSQTEEGKDGAKVGL